jgi:hypothetical protein
MAIMGHSDSTDMNLRYDTVDEMDLLDAADKLEANVTKLLPKSP